MGWPHKAGGKMPRKGIVCGGNLLMDYIKMVDVWPAEGMLANIDSLEKNPGGAVYNVLVDLAKMEVGIPLHAVGLMGDDPIGDEILDLLAKNKINIDFVFKAPGAKTSYTDVITVKSSGQRTFFHYRGAHRLLDPSYFTRVETNARIFHLGYLLGLDALDVPEKEYGTRAARVLASLREKGYETAVDVISEDSQRYAEVVTPCLRYIDYFIINEIEAQKITGAEIRKNNVIDRTALEKAARQMMRMGVRSFVVIHFPEGAIAADRNGEITSMGSFKIAGKEIKGTVGAGDAFCAGVLYGLHEDLDLREVLRIGHASAYFNLKDSTSTGGAVAMKQIREFLSCGPAQNKF